MGLNFYNSTPYGETERKLLMKFRAPAYPLITADPYFSAWSMADTLYGNTTKHWAGKPNTMRGTIHVDGKAYTFMGQIAAQDYLQQVECTLTALYIRRCRRKANCLLYHAVIAG